MGAKVVGSNIYIDKKLLNRLTRREKNVLLAHELSHYQHRDVIKMFLLKPLSFIVPKLANYFIRKIEIRADREAIKRTRDIPAFKSLLYKLDRKGGGYPSLSYSLQQANDMAGKI